jgi:hypothetical protein
MGCGVVGTGVVGRWWERNRRMNMVQTIIHMYVNAKMIPAETVPGIRGGWMGERSRTGDSSMIYLIHYKNLCKCYNVPIPSTAIKKKFKC